MRLMRLNRLDLQLEVDVCDFQSEYRCDLVDERG